jgi:hypothetical protein
MAIQDDRDRMAAINDATRTPMMQAVLGGPTNKRSQLQKQVAAERPVDAMTGAATKIPRPPPRKMTQLQKQVAAERAAGGKPFAYPGVGEVIPGARAELTNLMEKSFGPDRGDVPAPRPADAGAAAAPSMTAARPKNDGAQPAASDSPGALDALGLYRPKNVREAGDNARRVVGGAAALGKAGFDAAMAPAAAIRGVATEFGAGLLGIERPVASSGPAAPTITPFREGDVGLEDPANLAAIAVEQKQASDQALVADPRAGVRGAIGDQARAEDFVRGNKAPRSDALNINRPIPIPGSNMQYGGQYGDTAVIERPGANGERAFSDTSGVAGANPAMGGIARPGAAAPVQPAGEQLSPAEQYIRNTTMSDGTRAFGGSGSERLHQARLDALARGDGEAVTRSMMNTAERAAYDRRNDAYNQDPLKAYEIDQVTAAENAKAEAAAMRNYRQDLLQQAGLGLRQDANATSAGKATASARNASLTQANNIVKTLFPDEPEAGGILGAILEQAVASGNSASLNQLAATEAAKLRAAMGAADFDAQTYLAGYIDQGQGGSDFSAMDDLVPNL